MLIIKGRGEGKSFDIAKLASEYKGDLKPVIICPSKQKCEQMRVIQFVNYLKKVDIVSLHEFEEYARGKKCKVFIDDLDLILKYYLQFGSIGAIAMSKDELFK